MDSLRRRIRKTPPRLGASARIIQPATKGRAMHQIVYEQVPCVRPGTIARHVARASWQPRHLPCNHVPGSRDTKNAPCARWERVPVRGSLWLLPSGPDQIRNMSSSEPIERARRSVYLTCSRPAGQVGRTHRMDSPHSSISLAAPAVQDRAARCGQRADAGHGRERLDRQAAVAGVGHAALGAVAARAAAGAVI